MDTPLNKSQKLEYIWIAIRKAYPHKKLVFSDGSPDAKIMIIGEAPGPDEEKQGLPFVGRAGKLLNATLEALGWQRNGFYISNIVKYRPQDKFGKTLTPTSDEIEKFRPALEKEITIVDPELIVVLGRIAMAGLGIEGAMGQNHGRIVEKQIPSSPDGPEGKSYKILIVYHPAAILRNINLEPVFREDLIKIGDHMEV